MPESEFKRTRSHPIGMDANGNIRVLTPEEYRKARAERDADEAAYAANEPPPSLRQKSDIGNW
jgi:hypothetical protein